MSCAGSSSSGPVVRSVARDAAHRFSKEPVGGIELVEGLGVAGDAHAGRTIQHRSRLRRDADAPNLRQVHLIAEEFLAEAAEWGYAVGPGALGDNVLTAGLDLLGLPQGTMLTFGECSDDPCAAIEVTGLRNPCRQIDRFQDGLLRVALEQRPDGTLIRKVGIMAVVTRGGPVRPGMPIGVHLPAVPHQLLAPV
ncbi:MAG: MOSC domain-containing protein [Ornithinimicrobium sp.]|uniref:MOSC domain-containing protein n=1 Tax=Ornithinimicrobium sp. TaxID=1977084 RepID=UPI003D9BB34A